MRPGPLSLLVMVLLSPCRLFAEQDPQPPLSEVAEAQMEEQRLIASEQQHEALSAETQRLRQDNQRLKLQLKTAQAATPERLVSEQQMWFAIGAGSAISGVLVGALLRGSRRSRREWLN
nr:translation initiation factor 2 (IF-2, GTPase) [uncultured Pseudomonas sp.]